MAKDPGKTEKATPKRLNKARGKGNVPRSAELGKIITITIGLIIMYAWLGRIGMDMQVLMRNFFVHSFDFKVSATNVNTLFLSTAWAIAKMVLPVLLIIAAVVIIIMRVQVGKLWTWETMKPKLERFNPIAGIKRMVLSPQMIGRMLKSLAQAIIIGVAPYMVLHSEWDNFINLYYTNAADLASYILLTGGKMVSYALVPMLIIAAIDLIYTRWKYNEDLKMTKSEVKDEHKQSDGDPMIKSKQRQKMNEVMKRRMMQDVPKADVVITNPTHIAVALKYNSMEAPAPVVVAKGADRIAEKIKEIARENRVPIRENKPLARALYKDVDIGEMIPEDLYQAVASILASLSKFKKKPATPSANVKSMGRGVNVK